MKECMITLRSVTPAQRGEGLLRQAGISCTIRRTPRKMEEQGCGYALQVACDRLPEALAILRQQKLPIRKTYRLLPDGSTRELGL